MIHGRYFDKKLFKKICLSTLLLSLFLSLPDAEQTLFICLMQIIILNTMLEAF